MPEHSWKKKPILALCSVDMAECGVLVNAGQLGACSIARKYSPNPWNINASHPKKAGKSGDSNLMFHGFGEYLLSLCCKSLDANDLCCLFN